MFAPMTMEAPGVTLTTSSVILEVPRNVDVVLVVVFVSLMRHRSSLGLESASSSGWLASQA